MTRSNISKQIKMMYVLAAFAGALTLHLGDTPFIVHAQAKTASDYALESQIDVNNNLVNQLNATVSSNVHHLELTDARINDLSDKVSMMEGAASASLAVLGVLQIFGLITTFRAPKGPQ